MPTPISNFNYKRRKIYHHDHDRDRDHYEHEPLLPGLPDDIAQNCLSLLPPSLLFSVCPSWRRIIYSPSFPPFPCLYAILSHYQTCSLQLSCYDPICSEWSPLPPPPVPLCPLIRHPSFISRRLPIQSVTVAGKLVLLAATNYQFLPALNTPLVFDPLARNWSFGPAFVTPRRWCVAGSSDTTVYIASGVKSNYNSEVARSVERWDLKTNKWEKKKNLKDGKFSRDAIEAVGWRGKLYMVNVKGVSAKQGAVYDVERDTWEEMPEGMLTGWRGPAASLDEETIFVVDESKGLLNKYNPDEDVWEEIVVNERLKGAEHIVAGGGKACVVCGGRNEIVVVDVVANKVSPQRLWVVDAPAGFQVLGVHILPRMSSVD